MIKFQLSQVLTSHFESFWSIVANLISRNFFLNFFQHLSALATKFDKSDLSFEDQCTDKDITGAVLRELVQHGKKHRLDYFFREITVWKFS